MRVRFPLSLAVIAMWMSVTSFLPAQTVDVTALLRALRNAEREEAAARQKRLNWIDHERARIRGELQKYGEELAELKSIVPDTSKRRDLPPAAAKAQQREEAAFNVWAANNDPTRRVSVMRGAGLNALLRVLGPIAHYRRMRSNNSTPTGILPSLSKQILPDDAMHFRLVPATSAGSRVVVRLNQTPLEIEWPAVVVQNWSSDCKATEKLRDEFVALLSAAKAADTLALANSAELLDSSLSLLQAKVLQRKRTLPRNGVADLNKRVDVHAELQAALRYLETVRATVNRFRNAPGEFRIHTFPGGSIEELLDFCYTHGMIFQESRPDDEEQYWATYRAMQDYARDLQFVEDWKADLEQRVRELSDQDKRLVWMAASAK